MVQAITKIKKVLGVLMGTVLLAGPVAATDPMENPELESLFQEGMDALQDERLKSAIQTFSKILDTEPELHRAKLELALAYYRSLRYEDAEKLAKEVLDDPVTPPEVRVTILAFLAQIKRDSEQFGQKRSYTPFISAGIMHDSNANVGPTSAGIRVGDIDLSLTPSSLSRSDNAYVFNVGVDDLYQSGRRVEFGERTGMLVWQSGASLYSRKYNELRDYDLAVASINTGPAVLMLRHWRASLQYRAEYLMLGGGALGWFNSITPSVTWQFDNGELNWDAIYTRRFYHRDIDTGREGDYLGTGVTLGRYFNNRKVAATAGARLIEFIADDDQYGYTGWQINVGASTDMWHNGTAYARGRVSGYVYDGKDSLFNKDRDDLEYLTTIGVTHEYKDKEDLLRNWVVNIFWQRTHNDSNIGELYSYKRYQMMFNMSRSF